MCSLRGNKGLLHKLKRQLDILWGDLEEQKSAKQQAENIADPPSTFDSTASSPPPSHKPGDQPDADDSDIENEPSYGRKKSRIESALQDRDPNGIETTNHDAEAASKLDGDGKLAPRNKPFTCCIKQYGVKVEEKDPLKADAGNGQRWQRVFGLFGTFIA